jgi:hypothetical protein
MIRTQIQLSEEQAQLLKELAASRGQSVAQLIRESVAAYVGAPVTLDDATRRQRALEVVGGFRSGHADTSSRHDEVLAEAWRR